MKQAEERANNVPKVIVTDKLRLVFVLLLIFAPLLLLIAGVGIA